MADAPTTGPETPEVGDQGGAADDAISAPQASNNWWQFESKDDAEKWANDLITKRLSRHKKSVVDPIEQERDTLRAELEQLRPLKEATQTDTERWEAKLQAATAELDSLRQFKAETTHREMVRNIAEELGLPAKFISRVRGDDEDAIREDITDLLNVLSEGGSTPGKKTPTPKAPKAPEDEGKKSGTPGGGGDDSAKTDEDLIKEILGQAAKDRANGGLTTRR